MNINDTFGWWTVRSVGKKNGRNIATVECRCGKVVDHSHTNLMQGKTTKCRSCSYKNRGPLLAKRIGGTHLAAKDKYNDYKVKAKQRDIEWNLTFQEFLTLASENCYYCGEIPANVNRLPKKDWAEDFVYNGLDRYFNDQGYNKDNVLPCCKYCNYMKRELSYEEFCTRVSRIAAKHKPGSVVVII